MKVPESHKQVVNRVVDDLKPTKVVSLQRLYIILLSSTVGTLLVGTMVHGARRDFVGVVQESSFGVSLLCLTAALLVLGRYTAASTVPGRYPGSAWIRVFVPAATVIGLILYVDLFRLPFLAGDTGKQIVIDAMRCLTLIVVWSVPVALASYFLSRSAMPLNPRLTIGLALFTALVVGSLVAQVHCEIDYGLHRLIGHAIPGLAIVVLFILTPDE